MAVGVGDAAVGVGDDAVVVGVGDGAGVGLGVALDLGDALGAGDGFGVGEGFAAIMIDGAVRRRQATKPSSRGTVWRLFFDDVFTIISAS